MGNASVCISNPHDNGLRVEAVARIDVSERHTLPPAGLADRIALSSTSPHRMAVAMVALEGRRELSPLIISDTAREVVIGVTTLDALALKLDESTGELTESEYFLYVA